MSSVMLQSSKALGSGFSESMNYIMVVPASSFDSSRTRDMAAEISVLNKRMKSEASSYLLIGPGRWGSSDPWLGIPVVWSDISEARMIVETAIPGYQIEPSQGTHFFQNITSLGVGYLTVDTVRGDGEIDEAAISSLDIGSEGKYTKLYKAVPSIDAYIDRSTNKAVVGI